MRLPWKLTSFLTKVRLAARYLAAKLARRRPKGLTVQFFCGYHGSSGGSEAIAAVANGLSAHHTVWLNAGPFSWYNEWLHAAVGRTHGCLSQTDIFICDRSTSLSDLTRIKHTGKPVIASIHGLPDNAHGLAAERAFTIFDYADVCHFVTAAQADAFVPRARESIVIPNSSEDWGACRPATDPAGFAARLGMVGHFAEDQKNLAGNLDAGTASDASAVVVWGHVPEERDDPKIQYRGFGHDKQHIYNSFDVLITLSRTENLPLVIIQALSAGLPCVLSNITGHQSFGACPGVYLVDPDNQAEVISKINQALALKGAPSADIRAYWHDHYSVAASTGEWLALIARLAGQPHQAT